MPTQTTAATTPAQTESTRTTPPKHSLTANMLHSPGGASSARIDGIPRVPNPYASPRVQAASLPARHAAPQHAVPPVSVVYIDRREQQELSMREQRHATWIREQDQHVESRMHHMQSTVDNLKLHIESLRLPPSNPSKQLLTRHKPNPKHGWRLLEPRLSTHFGNRWRAYGTSTKPKSLKSTRNSSKKWNRI